MSWLSSLRTFPWRKAVGSTLRFIWKRLHLPVIPLALVLMLECLNRSSFRLTYEWILERPNEFWLNYWIALFLTLLVAAAIGRTRYGYAFLFLLFGTVGFISGMKQNDTGAPLYVWDVFLPQAGRDTVADLNTAVTRGLLWTALAAVGVTLGALLLRSVRLKWQERLLYAAASLFLLVSVYHNEPIAFWDELGVITVHYEQVYNYQRNGFLAAVADGLHFVLPDKPAGSGRAGIRSLVQQIEDDHPETVQANAKSAITAAPTWGTSAPDSDPAAPVHTAIKETPNVIVMLSESFWDPTLLKNVSFSSDPIPFFHSLMKSTTGGWMLSPQFGGTTANVEFEVLTGNSVRFLPKDSIAYINFVNRDVDSLASIFARQGYNTTAINPFFNWFFNSRNAYRSMGFSRFISSEFFEPRFHGPNYEDKQVMEKIIETTDNAPGPSFIFANTMENHGGYEDKFYDHPITVSGPISAQTKNMLENYATGEQAFDKAFQSLVEHYQKSGEPTVIMCFGDHFPSFGGSYYGYKDAGYLTGNDDPELMEKTHFTPFVIWDNFTGNPREELKTNASFLGTYLLHYLNKPGTYYTDMLYDLYRKQPLIPPREFIKDRPIDEAVLADYRRLQYDVLFGSQTGYKETGIAGHVRSSSFMLGYGSPTITAVLPGEKGRIDLTGERFNSESTVWLNGKPLRTTSWQKDKLTAWLPEGQEDHPPAYPWRIQVRNMDSKNAAIVQSDVFTMNEAPPAAAPSPSPAATAPDVSSPSPATAP